MHIPVQVLAGKFKIELLPTVSLTKSYPVAQICPNSHKIVSSYIGVFPVAQICPNSHRIVSSSIRAFPVAEIRPNLHKIVSSYIRAFPIAQICPNSHRSVQTRTKSFPASPSMHSRHGEPERARKGLKGPDEASSYSKLDSVYDFKGQLSNRGTIKSFLCLKIFTSRRLSHRLVSVKRGK